MQRIVCKHQQLEQHFGGSSLRSPVVKAGVLSQYHRPACSSYLGNICQLIVQLCCSILLLVELHLQLRQVLFGIPVLSCEVVAL